MKNYHIAVSIKGLEDRISGKISRKYGSWQVFSDDTGRLISKQETLEEIKKAKEKGWEVISACDFVNEKGHCKGHEEPSLASQKQP